MLFDNNQTSINLYELQTATWNDVFTAEIGKVVRSCQSLCGCSQGENPIRLWGHESM